MKFLITLTVGLILTFGHQVKASEAYYEAVIGHIAQSKLNGTNIDEGYLMEAELKRLSHQFAIESISILQKYLPSILDGVASEMRLQSDKEYKCSLLEGSKIEDDC